MENLFCVLGGGNRIGASCYYLQVDGCKFLLDCGMGTHGSFRVPNFSLLTNNYLDGLWELDYIILSHAHMDHVGALPYLDLNCDISILCNPITKVLLEHQFYTLKHISDEIISTRQKETFALKKDRIISMISEVSFIKPYFGDGYKITFFPAGHIPGAAMIYIETVNHRILYTGDFSEQSELMCGSYYLPDNLPVDLLIIEGTYAYGNDSWQEGYKSLEDDLINNLKENNIITIETNSITKGIELARYLSNSLQDYHTQLFNNIYLNQEMVSVAESFEKMGHQVYINKVKPLLNGTKVVTRDIVINKGRNGVIYGKVLNGDAFTLHATSQALIKLINKVQAETTIIVHAQPEKKDNLASGINIGNKTCIQSKDEVAYIFK